MKLLLVDGHYYVYRSFFAIRELTNSRGVPTNAIYGFVKVLRKMLRDLRPDFAAVIWDQGLPQRRTELQPAYKQTRTEMPETMRPQLAEIRELVPLLGLRSLSLPDTEADDLMASYACAARAEGHEVVLATNDKDLFQLVNTSIRVYSTLKGDLATPKDAYALLGEEYVRTKWGVEPARIADILALVGDSADNIPGVPGMGPKRAAALVNEHGCLETVLADPAKIANDGIRKRVTDARELIEANREMVRLDLDLPLPVPFGELQIRPQYEPLVERLRGFEFKSLTEEVAAEAAREAKQAGQGELF